MSLHADARATLAAWHGPDDTQEALRRRFVTHLDLHEDGLQRECRPDHVTASTLVISADGGRVLLTLHARAQRWFQLGGHCEADDATLAGAALREAGEESGIGDLVLDPVPLHLDEHAVPFCGPAASTGHEVVHHLDVRFVAVAPADAVATISPESSDLAWWPCDDLPPGADLARPVALARARVAGRAAHSGSGSVSPGGGSIAWAADQPSR